MVYTAWLGVASRISEDEILMIIEGDYAPLVSGGDPEPVKVDLVEASDLEDAVSQIQAKDRQGIYVSKSKAPEFINA